MSTELSQKSSTEYVCECCHYKTCSKKDYNKHISTDKHKTLEKSTFINEKSQQILTTFSCECGKTYKERTGLWRHKKKCVISNNECSNNDIENVNESNNKIQTTDKDDLINYLLKENQEFKNLILEIVKKDTNQITNNTNITTNNHNTTNSHNKAFNLNFFLNETCKDAMNIMDFVESIKLQVSDLESVGELGYIEGISNIIVKNLNALDVTQRPVHCTDKKRETIYIKDDNKWEKDEERKMMHKMIKKVADKNARLLPKFTEKYPDYKNYYSKTSDIYSKIIVESMGGSGDNDYEKEEKIIKNITKCVIVDKDA